MAMSLNKVQIIGQLGRDPETRTFSNGGGVTSFSVACSEKYKKDGAWVDKTEWVNVSVFNERAQKLAEYLTKGSLVYVDGKFSTRKYQDKSGQDKYVTEVVVGAYDGQILLLDSKKAEAQTTTRNKGRQEEFVDDQPSDEIPW